LGLLTVSKLPVPVVSVGNVTTGGTGKTPLVEWVCSAIASLGLHAGEREGKEICVLTRGYGRSNPKTQVVVSNGAELLAGEREAGDEPFLLAENLVGIAAVISNSNRAAAGRWAIEKWTTEVFVLDDGFQHLPLSRDLDIVIVDATNPWGGGGLLPYGRLRESPRCLSRADCVVITRAEQVPDLTTIKEAVQQFVGEAPIFSSRMLTSGIRRVDCASGDRQGALTQPVGAFCGVGNPESFFEHLRREGLQLAFTRTFADHHRYKQSEFDTLVKDAVAQGARSLITTAKDAIKLKSFNFGIPCYVLEIEILIDEEERLVEIIRGAISNAAS
ncbi:MAG: tetraacyldisaccharide 4'-kinase, partial [Acidobacteriota bacterium]|nr:tetraacyldisaccharide 4'-kinase [Acidobacteriota bacterium]